MEAKIYHIYNRGNHKEHICFKLKDYYVLKKIITKRLKDSCIDLLLLCIMPNHFHFVIGTYKPEHIPTAMRDIGRNYTVYMNRKYNLVGHLFQGPYKRKSVNNLVYFRVLVEYIRKNPQDISSVMGGICKSFENEELVQYYELLLGRKVLHL
jgi:REP element-mobilizing transposase RayT